MMISGEADLRDLWIAQHRAAVGVGRRRRTVPVRSSLIGLSVRGATIVAWLAMAAPATLAQTPPAQVTPAPVASAGAVPLSPAQEKALKPQDTFKECANCPEMTVVPA